MLHHNFYVVVMFLIFMVYFDEDENKSNITVELMGPISTVLQKIKAKIANYFIKMQRYSTLLQRFVLMCFAVKCNAYYLSHLNTRLPFNE